MRHAASLGGALFVFWLLLSGHFFEPLLIGFGVASCALVLWIAQRMDVVDHEGHPLNLRPLATLRYLPWLATEIVKANVDVVRRIVAREPDISPRVVRVRPGQAGELGRVIHANSITLTPGTVSMELDEEGIVVHALTRQAAEALGGEMDRRVSELEAPAP